jgi:quercetin dioxygenase-like cupin family protein
MNHFRKLSLTVNHDALLRALARQRGLWRYDTFWKEFPGSMFAEVDTIYLRFPDKRAYLGKAAVADEYENYDQAAYELLPEFRPVVAALMAHVGGERLGRVMVNRLPPGKSILPHSDTHGAPSYYDRYHVCLTTNPGVRVVAGGECPVMVPGDVWWFDHTAVHEAHNAGDTPRIHLVVDIRLKHARVAPAALPELEAAPLPEFHHADDVMVKMIPIRRGEIALGHKHTYDHTSFVASGAVDAWCDDKYVGTYRAPAGVLVKAGVFHRFVALEENTVLLCIHNTHGIPKDQLEDHLVAEHHPL